MLQQHPGIENAESKYERTILVYLLLTKTPPYSTHYQCYPSSCGFAVGFTRELANGGLTELVDEAASRASLLRACRQSRPLAKSFEFWGFSDSAPPQGQVNVLR
jgi:hypothetical protein